MRAFTLTVMAAGLAYGSAAQALDFGVMETATPIEPRHFKLSAYPLAVRDGGRTTDEDGFALALGYGLPHGVDVEGTAARFDGATIYGSDVEWQAWRSGLMAFSFGGGAHYYDLERGGRIRGLDSTAILTFLATPHLDLNAALDASFEDVNVDVEEDPSLTGADVDNRYETFYFAPGVQYRFTRNLEAMAEVGVGLNTEASDYASAGLSWYFR